MTIDDSNKNRRTHTQEKVSVFMWWKFLSCVMQKAVEGACKYQFAKQKFQFDGIYERFASCHGLLVLHEYQMQ